MHEIQTTEENGYHSAFVTLTYAPEHLPKDGSVHVEHFQDFMKRYRDSIAPQRIRFFHCGEYGEENKRPHYHAIIFGHDFKDKQLLSVKRGNRLYKSDKLEKLWGLGHTSIGSANFQSAGYVARYIMKKINGDDAEEHYTTVDKYGEIHHIRPEYITMSRRPGLGYEWFQKYKNDLYPSDQVVINGMKYTVPRYYDKLLEKEDPLMLEEMKILRIDRAEKNKDNSTDERLAVREQCKSAQLRRLQRPLETI